jgi:hypothetical protein
MSCVNLEGLVKIDPSDPETQNGVVCEGIRLALNRKQDNGREVVSLRNYQTSFREELQ